MRRVLRLYERAEQHREQCGTCLDWGYCETGNEFWWTARQERHDVLPGRRWRNRELGLYRGDE